MCGSARPRVCRTSTRLYHAPTEALAGFADANVSLASRLRVLGGIRYTTERRGLSGTSTTFATVPTVPLCPAGVATPGPAFRYCFVTDPDNSVSNNAVTWRGGLEVDVAQDSMAYLTVNRGFKSGGVYSGPAPGNTYEPEFLTSFDTGIRNRFLENTLQLNLEAFCWLYRDYQFTFINFASNGTQALVTTNAGKARLYGANADIILTPTSADTLSATVEYLSTEFTDFSYTTPIAVDAQRSCASRGIAGSAILANGSTRACFQVRLFRRAARARAEMVDSGSVVAQLRPVPGLENRCGRRCVVQLVLQARRDCGGLSDAESLHDRQRRPGLSQCAEELVSDGVDQEYFRPRRLQ